MEEEKLKIDPATIARTVVLFIALVNAFCALVGWKPLEIDQSIVYNIVSGVAVIVTSIICWWKDNDITQKALFRKKVANELTE